MRRQKLTPITLTPVVIGLSLLSLEARADNPPPRPGKPMQAIGEIRLSAGSNLCLDLQYGSATSGTNVHAWDCHGGPSQRWYFGIDGLIRSFKNPDVCLDVDRASGANGTNIKVYDCHGGAAQQWRVTTTGHLQSRVAANRCLDVSSGGSHNGANVQLWSCWDGDNQKWTINRKAAVPALQAAGKLRSAAGTNICLDASAAGTSDGTNVQSWTCDDVPNQDWYFTMYGEIRAGHAPGMCLDMAGGNTANGTNVQLYRCNGTAAQQWELTEEGTLRNAVATDSCLDVSTNPHNGSTVYIWSCHGLAHQRWKVTRIPWAPITAGTDFGLCLRDSGGTAQNGDNVEVVTCQTRPEQLWTMTAEGEIRNGEGAGRCLDVAGGSQASDTNVQSWECNGSDAQRWILTPRGELRSVNNSDLCLDRTSSGNVVVHTCHQGDNQKWVSKGLMQVQLTQVGNYYGILLRRGATGQMVTNPRSVLGMMASMGYNEAALLEIYSRLTAEQILAVPVFRYSDYATTNRRRAVLSENVFFPAPQAQAEFLGNLADVRARASLDFSVADGDDVPTGLLGPEVSVVGHFDRGFTVTAGGSLIGAATALGDAGGGTAGIGLDGATILGTNGHYGVTLGINSLPVDVFVVDDDFVVTVDLAADWTPTALDATEYWLEAAASTLLQDTLGLLSQLHDLVQPPALQLAEWITFASYDAGDWLEGAGESIGQTLCSVFCW